MSIDRSILLNKLKSEIEKAYDSSSAVTDVIDILSLVLSTKAISDVNLLTVNTINDLPNLQYYDSPSGMIYYVEEIGVLVVSSTDRWLTLDGRLVRQDTAYSVSYAWGSDSNGELGIGGTGTKCSPAKVLGNFTNWLDVAAGLCHSLGITRDGKAWAWGTQKCGVLGNLVSSYENIVSPVSVAGGFTDWCQVSAGNCHSAGLRANGTLWSWGCTTSGNLGNGSTVSGTNSPVSVVGGFTDWCQISSSVLHAMALRSNGTLWGWGCGAYGRLGNALTTNQNSPVSVVGGFTDWCQVSTGSNHTAAIRTNGTLWTWGRNTGGVLGINSGDSNLSRSSPVSVVGGFTDWCLVASSKNLGASISAIRTNGTLWTWGAGNGGALGSNSTASRSSPATVVGGFTDWCKVDMGAYNGIGLRSNGTAWGWGQNQCGQLGNGTTVTRSSPVSIIGGINNWCKISIHQLHSLGLTVK